MVYGPNQDRIKHSDSNGRVTKYVGGIYEEVTKAGITQKIHYVGDFASNTQSQHDFRNQTHIFASRSYFSGLPYPAKNNVLVFTPYTPRQSLGAGGGE